MAALPGLPRLRLPHEPPSLPPHRSTRAPPPHTAGLHTRFHRGAGAALTCAHTTAIPQASAISVGDALDLNPRETMKYYYRGEKWHSARYLLSYVTILLDSHNAAGFEVVFSVFLNINSLHCVRVIFTISSWKWSQLWGCFYQEVVFKLIVVSSCVSSQAERSWDTISADIWAFNCTYVYLLYSLHFSIACYLLLLLCLTLAAVILQIDPVWD